MSKNGANGRKLDGKNNGENHPAVGLCRNESRLGGNGGISPSEERAFIYVFYNILIINKVYPIEMTTFLIFRNISTQLTLH